MLCVGGLLVGVFATGSAQKHIDEIMGPVGVDPLDVAALSAPRLHGRPNPLLDSNAFGSNMVLAADDCVLFGVRRPTALPGAPLAFSRPSCLISCAADITCVQCGARRSGCTPTLPHRTTIALCMRTGLRQSGLRTFSLILSTPRHPPSYLAPGCSFGRSHSVGGCRRRDDRSKDSLCIRRSKCERILAGASFCL